MSKHFFALGLISVYLIGAIILAWQPVRGIFDPKFQGLLPYGGSEEAMYMLRTQEAVIHPWFADTTNGIWQHSDAPPGLQLAQIEYLIGSLFSWTGLSAPWLIFVLSVIITPLVVPLTALLLRKNDVGYLSSIILAALYFFLINFGRRYFHPGFSLPIVIAALLAMTMCWQDKRWRDAIIAGMLLGFSVGVYFWSWTFLWATAGLLLLASVFAARRHLWSDKRTRLFFTMIGIAILVALPSILHMLSARGSELFAAVSLRVGLVSSSALESPARSLLLTLLCIATIFFLRRKNDRKHHAPLLAALLALAIAFSQQLLHGKVLSFSSHYYQYICLLAIIIFGIFLEHLLCNRKHLTFMADRIAGVAATIISLIFLVGAYNDYGSHISAFEAPSTAHQHLAQPLELLRNPPKNVVLTDIRTADMVASYTDDDVVATEYAEILLISDGEYIERICTSEAFALYAPKLEDLVTFAEARLRVIRGQQAQVQYDAELMHAQEVCDAVRAKPFEYLQKFGVTVLLWNEYLRPDWLPEDVQAKLTIIVSGNGWSVWQL